MELRHAALAVLCEPDPEHKVRGARALGASPGTVDPGAVLEAPPTLPGRPPRPVLVHHTQLVQRPLSTPEGRAALLHALAHIEFNAIDLALDAVWRFPDMPEAFYADWIRIADEEALHFTLLRTHLVDMGFDYGDFPAHNALWEMAERTRGDVLARIALVPRTLEARGLDASPAVRAKLIGAGDRRAGEILDVILRDEIGHVAAGNRWFAWLCEQRGLDRHRTYAELVRLHEAPRLRGPFNLEARRAAGFTEEELAALSA